MVDNEATAPARTVKTEKTPLVLPISVRFGGVKPVAWPRRPQALREDKARRTTYPLRFWFQLTAIATRYATEYKTFKVASRASSDAFPISSRTMASDT